MRLELLAMVDMKMLGEFGNLSMDDVVEQKSFTTTVGANETGTSAISFQDQVGVFEEDLVSVGGLHGETLNFDIFWESLSGSQLESLVLGEASDDVLSFGEVASVEWFLLGVWFSHLYLVVFYYFKLYCYYYLS
jgi:hypothetical protein